jgi:hypothetical protein
VPEHAETTVAERHKTRMHERHRRNILKLVIGGPVALVVIGVVLALVLRPPRRPLRRVPRGVAPATAVAPGPPPRSAEDRQAEALFERALRAAETDTWLSVDSYLLRMKRDYASTPFYTSHQSEIDALRARTDAALGRAK